MSAVRRATAIVADAFDRFGGRLALACSFGAPAGMSLLDIALRVAPDIAVYYIDTGMLFPETYALVERAGARYGIVPHALASDLSLDHQAAQYGDALWTRDPDRCCALRKVVPQRAFLRDFDAWMTGIRRVDGPTRSLIEPFVADGALTKVSPLFDWTHDEVAAYVAEHDVPVNALNAQGFPSVGCTPCTRAVRPGEDSRAGRWPGFVKTECGLHVTDAVAQG
ncbi:MAG: phosphoadenylyl-sulfate reductase [Candidatus Velthaea sp.]